LKKILLFLAAIILLVVIGWFIAFVSFWNWHGEKREFEEKEQALYDAPGGADYPAIIALHRNSGRPDDIISLSIGMAIIGSYEDNKAAKRPKETLEQGFQMLEKLSARADNSEGSISVDQRLRLSFERGLGDAPNYIMAPIPQLAQCWMKVEEDSYDEKIDDPAQIQKCIALRRQLQPGGAIPMREPTVK
jgi:hypothetical protein